MRLAAVGEDGAEDLVVAPGGEVRRTATWLVSSGGTSAMGTVLDQDAEDPLVELLGEAELPEAPVRIEPRAADQEEHRLAAVRRLVEPALPALARGDAALGVEVEEEVVPALGGKPVAKRDRFGVVGARMADERCAPCSTPGAADPEL